MKKLKYCENYQNVTQRKEVRNAVGKNGVDRLPQQGSHRASVYLFKKAVSLSAIMQSTKKTVILVLSLCIKSIHFQLFFTTSVQFSCSVVSDSLRPHELQHTRPPCPSPTPGVHSDSRPSSQ